MNPKLLLAFIAAACLGGLFWFLQRDGGPPADTELPARGPELPTQLTPEDEVELETVGPVDVDSGARTSTRTAAPTAAAEATLDHPWAEHLAGVTGRVVEADGTPVEGIDVELLQLDITTLLDADSRLLGNEDITVAEGVTNSEGRFTLEGATLGSIHVFGIDLGGPRSTVRMVERALAYDELVDVGDLTLDEFGTLLGTVLDEDGEPVAGARVRVAPVPEIVAQSGVLDLRADSLVGVAEGGTKMVFEIPPLVARHLERLPVPTTYTAEDGTFRLDGVPLATVCGGIDHAGYTATIIPSTTVKEGETDLGELDLEYGRVLAGRVVDGAGEPVAGAEVAAGALHPMAPVGLLQPAGRTDADGRFELQGIPELGQGIAFARRKPFDEWIASEEGGSDRDLEIRVGSVAGLRAFVTDASGEPVSGADVSVSRIDALDGQGMGMMFMFSTGGFSGLGGGQSATATEGEPGTYVVAELGLGRWLVEARFEGSAPVYASAEVGAGGTDVSLTLDPGRSVDVRVVDANTQQPIVNAHASIVGVKGRTIGTLAAKWSNAEGRAKLGPFADSVKLPDSFLANELDSPIVRVVHPEYGEETLELAAGQSQVEFALQPACEIAGRIHWGGGVPDRPYTVILQRRGINGFREAFATPRFTLSDSEGRFHYGSLAAGEYRLEVMERFLDVSPLDLMIEQREPVQRARQEVLVAGGPPTQVEVDLSPNGLGPTARITGVVSSGGLPVADADVSLRGASVPDLKTDSQGRFDTGEISALRGGYSIEIEGEITLADGSRERQTLYNEWVRVEAGETKQLEVDVTLTSRFVEVVDAVSGQPIVGAEITTWDTGQKTFTTGSDGRAELLIGANKHSNLRVSADTYADGAGMFDESSEEVLRIELVRAVRCQGRVVPGPGVELASGGWMHLQLSQKDGPCNVGEGLRGAERTFDFDNVAPGQYVASFWGPNGQGEQVEFEIGPNGVTNLELVYTPESD